MSIGSYSCRTSWEGEGGSSQRGRKRRSYGLSKARGSVSRPWLLSTSRTKTKHLVLRNRLWHSLALIHRSAWKVNSRNFAVLRACEIQGSGGGASKPQCS